MTNPKNHIRMNSIIVPTPTTTHNPGALFQLMTQTQRQTLFDNTARAIQVTAAPLVDPNLWNDSWRWAGYRCIAEFPSGTARSREQVSLPK